MLAEINSTTAGEAIKIKKGHNWPTGPQRLAEPPGGQLDGTAVDWMLPLNS